MNLDDLIVDQKAETKKGKDIILDKQMIQIILKDVNYSFKTEYL